MLVMAAMTRTLMVFINHMNYIYLHKHLSNKLSAGHGSVFSAVSKHDFFSYGRDY